MGKRTNYILSEDQHRVLKREAERKGVSVSEVLRRILDNWMLETGRFVVGYRFSVWIGGLQDGFASVRTMSEDSLGLIKATCFMEGLEKHLVSLDGSPGHERSVRIVVDSGRMSYEGVFEDYEINHVDVAEGDLPLSHILLKGVDFMGVDVGFDLDAMETEFVGRLREGGLWSSDGE